MKVTDTKIPDLKIIEPTVFEDERGFFFESFNHKKLEERLLGAKLHSCKTTTQSPAKVFCVVCTTNYPLMRKANSSELCKAKCSMSQSISANHRQPADSGLQKPYLPRTKSSCGFQKVLRMGF